MMDSGGQAGRRAPIGPADCACSILSHLRTTGIDEEAAAAAAEVAELFRQGPVRRAFVQKVLAIVCMQLLFTALVAILFYVYTPLRVRSFRISLQ